jgi:hypothetical protein
VGDGIPVGEDAEEVAVAEGVGAGEHEEARDNGEVEGGGDGWNGRAKMQNERDRGGVEDVGDEGVFAAAEGWAWGSSEATGRRGLWGCGAWG